MMRVAQGFHDEILWQFMSVDHTKCRPDEGFGPVRKHIGALFNFLSMTEILEALEGSSETNHGVLFPVQHVVGWKGGMYAPKIDGIPKNVSYRIIIRAFEEHGVRKVKLDVCGYAHSSNPDRSVMLLNADQSYPNFLNFYDVDAPTLSLASRTMFYNDGFTTLARNRMSMTVAVRYFWVPKFLGFYYR